jgi:hypothetical protein
VTSGPQSCPACSARTDLWGCDPEQSLSREEIHPLVWHETAWMADAFSCRTWDAGWIQPDGRGTLSTDLPQRRIATPSFESEHVRALETVVPAGDTAPLHSHLAKHLMLGTSGSHFVSP